MSAEHPGEHEPDGFDLMSKETLALIARDLLPLASRLTHEKALLGEALGRVLVASGLVVDAPMTGPELLAHAATLAASFGSTEQVQP